MHTPAPYHIYTILNAPLYRASQFAFSISLSCNASISPFIHQFSAEPSKASSCTSSAFKLSSDAQGTIVTNGPLAKFPQNASLLKWLDFKVFILLVHKILEDWRLGTSGRQILFHPLSPWCPAQYMTHIINPINIERTTVSLQSLLIDCGCSLKKKF